MKDLKFFSYLLDELYHLGLVEKQDAMRIHKWHKYSTQNPKILPIITASLIGLHDDFIAGLNSGQFDLSSPTLVMISRKGLTRYPKFLCSPISTVFDSNGILLANPNRKNIELVLTTLRLGIESLGDDSQIGIN